MGTKRDRGNKREGIVFSEEQLPPGFEAIGPLNVSNKPLHSYINRECTNNRVDRFRLAGTTGYGRLYVHKDDIAKLTAQWNEHHAVCDEENRPAEVDAGTLREIRDGIVSLVATLDRIANAAESVATQPMAELHNINGNPALPNKA